MLVSLPGDVRNLDRRGGGREGGIRGRGGRGRIRMSGRGRRGRRWRRILGCIWWRGYTRSGRREGRERRRGSDWMIRRRRGGGRRIRRVDVSVRDGRRRENGNGRRRNDLLSECIRDSKEKGKEGCEELL